jgi:hypothetical protein
MQRRTRLGAEPKTGTAAMHNRPIESNRRRTVTEITDRAGLGKVIYNVDEGNENQKPSEDEVDNAKVQEADKESFPASDPPGYAGGKSTEST